jgi:gliding motility-associated-like protein
MLRIVPGILIASLLLFGSTSYGQVNLNSGLVAYYPFNGNFADASGNGNNGTGMNGVGFGTDQWGNTNNAADFDGNNDYIAVPPDVSITPGHNFSMAFRFKTTSTVLQVLFSKSDWAGTGAPNNFQYQVGINGGSLLPSNGLFYATAHTGNTCVKSQFYADHYSYGSNTANNTWYCVVLTFDNGVKKVFMNGFLISTNSVSGKPNNTDIDSCTGGQLRIGAWWQNDPRWFEGLIDEVRLWNRSLNQQEVDSLCNLRVYPPGTINSYAAVTGRVSSPCANGLTVDDASALKAGDTVLMIQMKGATIDTSNTASFGTVTSYNGAGNYEQNIVQSVTGNTINLFYDIKRSYDIPHGLVQLVRVPYYTSYATNRILTCMPWTGTKGGVFAINVKGTLNLNDEIDVSGKGFRGGVANSVYRGSYQCNVTDYYHPPNMDSSAEKGEGISTVSTGKTYARGRLGNGGGGGNAANAGGGGGSNGGAGGQGGNQYAGCTGSTPATSTIGGIGGNALTYSATANKVFLGGGGGAGQANEQVNSDGGAGGGIIFINAGSIAGGSKAIKANGAAAPECSAPTFRCNNDGTGGGGGGGSILIAANSFSSVGSIEAKGGKGANLYLTTPFLNMSLYHGPGGGGGGGSAWVSSGIASSISGANVNGGANGVLPQNSNNAFGSSAGSAGQKLSTLQFVMPVDTFKPSPVPITFTYRIVSCNTVAFTAAGVRISSYNWNFGDGGTSTVATPTHVYLAAGTYTVKLTVIDSNGCTGVFSSPVVVTNYSGTKKDTGICFGQGVVLSVYDGAVSYTWSPPNGLSSTNTSSTTASPASTTTYIVNVNTGNGCIFKDTFVVTVSPATVANFFFTPTFPIPNTAIKFTSTGSNASSYTWDFGDGTYGYEANPSHLYKKTGSYRVCLIVKNGKECIDSLCKTVEADVKTAIAIPTAFSPNGDGVNDILYVRGGAVQSFILRIFNRWGQLVFETNDFSKGWDGTFKGQPQDMDIFAYVLTASFIDGSTRQHTGNISLLR